MPGALSNVYVLTPRPTTRVWHVFQQGSFAIRSPMFAAWGGGVDQFRLLEFS